MLVRTPQADALARTVEQEGGKVLRENDGALVVTGLEAARIGELAHRADAVLHELTPQRASLEEAFMELTSDSVEFHGGTQ